MKDILLGTHRLIDHLMPTTRFLLIFIVLSQLCVRPVPVSADNTYTPNVATTYRLQARCSQKQVQVISNKVSANARRQTEFTRIRVESLATPGNGTYYVRLQSEKYKTYICFNKNGGLRVMEYRANRRCQFTVRQDKDMYTRYQLATHERWYIGFRKNGHPIRGTKRHRRTKCYQFLPIKVQPDRQGPMGSMSEGQRWKMLLDLQAHSRGRSTRRGGVHRRRTGSRTQRPDQT